jgi:hypothetical protein
VVSDGASTFQIKCDCYDESLGLPPARRVDVVGQHTGISWINSLAGIVAMAVSENNASFCMDIWQRMYLYFSPVYPF